MQMDGGGGLRGKGKWAHFSRDSPLCVKDDKVQFLLIVCGLNLAIEEAQGRMISMGKRVKMVSNGEIQ